MATESNSKRYAEEVDRISNLPECLLYDILSLLRTKQAVATSALSKRWKLLWTKLTVLDFQHSVTRNQDIGNNNGRMTFTHFVCNVLLLHKPLPVKKFRLALDSFDDSIHFHVSSWICYAVDHGVEELELLLLFRKPFELPRCFFGCKSLKIVTLYGDIVLNCPSFVHLPNLKDLRLGSQLCSNEDSFRSGLIGIPNLITFFIGRVRQDDVTTINICHPRLLFFCIQNKVPFPFKIEIDAPSLKCLSFFDGSGQDSLTTNIVKATFNLSEHKQQADEHDSCGHLLTELPSVQSLLVRHTKVQSLRFGFSLPMLNILRSLQFDAKCCKWHILPRLLESAPNLEKLILHKVDTDGPHELCCWTDPPHVPKCLESCLWIISLVKFKCWEHDLEFVQFFLKNAKVLEKMGILTGLLDFAENS
ncbi:F-box/LRR-repeat protein At3g26922-like isoform X3 [Quercus lobata]|uniref:F-box/LRR-repeat protein At3g26922-like isoform X3 n=1 Tax=Quercus lobata TaxID=97700 RepID=UPI0012471465|nr:F-box/LRR-repeat protein At3g26922-like isoform X3 [Quercus lobata]